MNAVINFFNKFSREQKLVLVFCAIVIFCTLYRECILCKYIPKLDGFRLGREGFEGAAEPKVVLFYADWCGHCKALKPAFSQFEEKMGKKIRIERVNADEKPEIVKANNVQGFPTIILFKGDKRVVFEGERNLENLVEFVEKNM
jgi:protein disulfide-isomerase-like protein